MEAWEGDRLDLAMEKFERALYCEEDFSAAYGGKAMVAAQRAKQMRDPRYREVEVKQSQELLQKAAGLVENDNDRFEYQLARLRVLTPLKEKDWLKSAEDAAGKALKLTVDEKRLYYYQGKEAAFYFIGVAYLEGQDRSPFPDLKATSPFYNAVLNMTSRGIMEGDLSGEFRINEPVSGAEAILAIRMLQQKINIH